MILRYVFRHLRRSLLKSLLCLLLAGALIAALGQFIVVVQQAHETVDEMYADLEVDAMIVSRSGTDVGGVPYEAMHALLDTDFYESFYATASGAFYWVNPNETEHVNPDDTFYSYDYSLIATNEPERFVGTPIEYLDGYGESTFAESIDYVCCVSREVSEMKGFALGDEVRLSSASPFTRETLPGRQKDGTKFKIVGIYESNRIRDEDLIVPLWALDKARGDFYFSGEGPGITYAEFRVRNDLLRDDAAYRTRPTAVFENSSNPAISRYTLRYLDDELRSVVRPLESNANTLRLLLPIIAVVVLIIGAAIPSLVVVQTSKDAAIMRVLGMTKAKVRAILVLEQGLLCLAGLALGVAGLAIFHGETLQGDALGASAQSVLLGLAAGHLALATAASLVSSVIVSARKPLELLQAKE